MCVKRSVYVAGFDRGVRPIGFWSISITLSKQSIPSTESWSPGLIARLVQPVGERLVDDLVHERRLARARHAGDADEVRHREVDVDALQVVHAGAAHREPAAVLVAARRHGDRPPSGEELAGDRRLVLLHLRGGALGDDVAAVLARARAPCRRGGRPRTSSARRARRRARCCRGRAAARASRSACCCRAGGARSTARRGCRARRPAASRSASPAVAAAPRRRTASPPHGRAAGSRRRRCRGTSAARGSP